MRPKVKLPYAQLVQVGKQAESIANVIDKFSPRRGSLSEFDEAVSHLTPQSSANQFEESLKALGLMLGFSAERPEHIYNGGPDVLWILDNKTGLVIEAKSRKKQKNAFTKEQHGQLLIAMEWLKKEYPAFSGIPVSIQPSDRATPNAVADNSRVLTYGKLNELIAEARELYAKLVAMVVSSDELAAQCEYLLASTNLQSGDLINHYLSPFRNDEIP